MPLAQWDGPTSPYRAPNCSLLLTTSSGWDSWTPQYPLPCSSPIGDSAHQHCTPVPRPHLQPVVDHQQRVDWVVEHVVVDGDAVQVLLEDGAQVGVLALQPRLLLVDGGLVQQGLVGGEGRAALRSVQFSCYAWQV